MATAEAKIALHQGPRESFGGLGRALTSVPFLGVALAAVAWPIVGIVPGTGPDASWAAGLYMAHGEGLQFGRDLVFTYGPLGFLGVPALYQQGLFGIAFLYQALLHVGVAVSLLWFARRVLPLPLAVAAAYCLLAIGRLGAAAVLLALLWALAACEEEPPGPALPLAVVGGSLLGAIELLDKTNYGLTILALSAVAVLANPGRKRRLTTFAALFCCFLSALWLAAGQDLALLPEFLLRQREVVSGYSGAMGTDIAAAAWQLPMAIGCIALLGVGTVLANRHRSRPRKALAVVVVLLFSLACFKQGFVRQGYGNTPEFFVLIAAAAMAVGAGAGAEGGRRRLAAAALVASLTAVALYAVPGAGLWGSLQPRPHLEALREGSRALIQPGYGAGLRDRARAEMRDSYRLSRDLRQAIGRQPVHVDPWEAGIAWAYDLNWQPLPVMQSYVAYTPGLDAMNARSLADVSGPKMILRRRGPEAGLESGSIDGRYPGWESPAAMRAMLCHYREVRAEPPYQLLERFANRCGAAHEIAAVRGMTGSTISIPPPPSPSDMVFVRIDGIGIGGLESVRNAFYRPRRRTAQFDDGSSWNLTPATAADGLILRLSKRRDYGGRFAVSPNAGSLRLAIAGSGPRPVTLRFFAAPISSSGSMLKGRPGPADRTP